MRDFGALTRKLVKEGGLKQTGVASATGATQGTVSRWTTGSVPEPHHQEALLELEREVFKLDVTDADAWIIRVDGRIGAGAAIDPDAEQVPEEGLYQIRAPFAVPTGSRAFVVAGDSMQPFYKPGDVIVCWRQATDPQEILGKEAVVQTIEGRRFLKLVRRGSTKRVFDLASHNATDMHDQKIAWAAKVGAIIKADEVEELRRRASPKKFPAKRGE